MFQGPINILFDILISAPQEDYDFSRFPVILKTLNYQLITTNITDLSNIAPNSNTNRQQIENMHFGLELINSYFIYRWSKKHNFTF
jgi:hypothetical protein